MKRTTRLILSLAVAALMPATVVLATMWVPKKVTCPLCGTVNTFSVILSYGGYIYGWPSKYQYIFWPHIDDNVAYSCKKCRLTTLMGDFSGIPGDKHEALRNTLKGVAFSEEPEEYNEIPMHERLEVAEKVYRVLGRDDDFWCRFYRVTGYHYGEAGMQAEAAGARKKALTVARKMLAENRNEGVRKELLAISGAMKRLLGDEDRAMEDFREAAGLIYRDESMPPDDSDAEDEYLSGLIAEFIGEDGASAFTFYVLLPVGAACALCIAVGAWYFGWRRRRSRQA